MVNGNNIIVPLLITIVTSFTTGIIASIIASRQYWMQKEADLDAEYSSRFNTKKWEIYTEFIGLAPKLISDDTNSGDTYEETSSLDALAAKIVLVGSDDVVTAFRIWRQANDSSEPGNKITNEKFSRLIAQMRKDLGNQYTQLELIELLKALNPSA